jgi:hypothetical protein
MSIKEIIKRPVCLQCIVDLFDEYLQRLPTMLDRIIVCGFAEKNGDKYLKSFSKIRGPILSNL